MKELNRDWKLYSKRIVRWLQASLSIFFFIVSILSCPVFAEEVKPFSFAENESYIKLISSLKKKGDQPTIDTLSQANKKYPVFIFIPGILGSKLELEHPPGSRKFTTIWGCEGLKKMFINNKLLYYSPIQKDYIRVSPLRSFEFLSIHWDIYGKCFDTIANLQWTGLKHFFQFAYDWRQDNRLSALDLDKAIKSWHPHLKDRPIVFIAHSMGGLVFKWWYHNFFLKHKKDYKFKIEQVLFLGTPHTGSPATCKAFSEGFNLICESGSFLQGLQKIEQASLTRHLNNNGPTFHSVYQLLPFDEKLTEYEDLNVPYLQNQTINLFAVDVWRKLKWPHKEIFRLSHEKFYVDVLPRMLDSAWKFHEFLNNEPIINEAIYCFSFQHSTPVKFKVTRQCDGKLLQKVIVSEKAGDGTVPTDIAKNWNRVTEIKLSRPLSLRHKELVNDEAFYESVVSYIRKGRLRRSSKLSTEIARDVNLLNELAFNRIMLPMPVLKDESAIVNPDMIAFANTNIFARSNPKIKTANELDKALYLAARDSKDPNTRIQLYATYCTNWHKAFGLQGSYTSPAVRMGWANNNLGNSLTEQSKWEDAKSYFENATVYAGKIKDQRQKETLYKTAKRNLRTVDKVMHEMFYYPSPKERHKKTISNEKEFSPKITPRDIDDIPSTDGSVPKYQKDQSESEKHILYYEKDSSDSKQPSIIIPKGEDTGKAAVSSDSQMN